MCQDVAYFAVPLPEDVQKLKMFGDYAGAGKLIDALCQDPALSEAMRKRLELERQVLLQMDDSEYPFSFEEAYRIVRDKIPDFQREELTVLRESGEADWIYRDGMVYFQKSFCATLLKTRPDYAKRACRCGCEPEDKDALLNQNIRQMKEHGGRTVKLHLKTSIQARKEFEQTGRRVLVHLPIPRRCQQTSEIEILNSSHEIFAVAPEDAVQKTVSFETVLKPDEKFWVEYSYVNHVDYVNPDPDCASAVQPEFDLNEEAPHIRFTPYLKLLLGEILKGEENPVNKARKIYDYITAHVTYSYMREYFCIDNLSEYAAVNRKGDCGVQAILFITLCRMAGIPARWQSGLYVTPSYTGCHDWAQFYVAPYGWLFADLSFGGSAYRAGEMERWNYYFGNLDVFRMAANSGIQSPFIPPKQFLRADPIDNQSGELEYEDHGLLRPQAHHEQTLIAMTEISENRQSKRRGTNL